MKKHVQVGYTLLTILLTGVTFAQDYFVGGAQTNATGGSVSASDFQEKVKSMGEQNLNQLNQQQSQMLSGQSGQGPANNNSNATNPNPIPPGTPATPNPSTAETPQTTLAPPTNPAEVTGGGFSSSPVTQGIAPAQTPPPAQTNEQVYTGFGAGNSGNTRNNSSNNNGNNSGWNIKY
jgi:hypothetical protein